MPIRGGMRINELAPGQLLASPKGEILKVQSVQFKRLKAQIVYPLQKQTTFREYGEDMVTQMREPGEALLAKYEKALESRKKKKQAKS